MKDTKAILNIAYPEVEKHIKNIIDRVYTLSIIFPI